MKKSHKREILMTRIIFVLFLVIVVLIIAMIVMLATSGMRNKANKKQQTTETSSQSESTEDEDYDNIWDVTELGGEEETETESEPEVEVTKYVWTTTKVNFRSEPNTDCDVLATLPSGTKAEVIEELDGWVEVMYNDQTGYLSSDYVTYDDPEATDTGGDDADSDDGSGSDQTAAVTSYTAAAQVAVVLDPGHQTEADTTREANGPGSSTMKARVTGGTTGVASGVAEYQLNLDISLLLKKELESRGYTVYLTRASNDVNLSNKERAEYATSVGGDIFVRIHANGSDDSSVNGALTITPSSSNPYVASLASSSMKLAQCILDAYCSATGFANDGCTTSDTMTGINYSTMPVVILEMGYMSNATEDQQMQDSNFRLRMVQGIANGIDAYFGF